MSKIFYPRKSQGGSMHLGISGRNIHKYRSGGNLLAIPKLGVSNVLTGLETTQNSTNSGQGVSQASEQLDKLQKQPMQNVMNKLQKLQVRSSGKKKNINFVV